MVGREVACWFPRYPLAEGTNTTLEGSASSVALQDQDRVVEATGGQIVAADPQV